MPQPESLRIVTEEKLELFIDTQAASPVATIAELPAANSGNRGLIRFVTAENEPYYSNGTTWSSIAQGAQGDPGPAGAGVPAGGSALQIVRKNSVGTTTEWATPTKSMVGLANVDNTADMDKPISSPTEQALQGKAEATAVEAIAPSGGARAVGKGELFLNVLDYGAVGDGVADDAAALNAANVSATTFGARLLVPAGTYRITETVRFTTDTQVSASAVFEYYGTGTALVMGDPTKILFNLDMQAPNVKYKTDTVWGAASVGVELVNLNTCVVLLRTALGFHTGFKFIGRGGGFAYSTITLGYSNQNRIGHHLTQDEGGWCNQNTFIGGRVQLVAGIWGATIDDVGAHYFLFEQGSVGISGPNNNTFVNCTMEGGAQAYHRIKFVGARYNTFLNCRYENYGSTYRVGYFQRSSANRIDGGYDVWKIVEEFDATSTGGSIRDGVGGMFNAPGIGATTLANGVMTRLDAWSAPTLRRVSYDSAGRFVPRAGRWRVEAVITFEANATGYRKAFLVTSGGVTIDLAEMAPSAGTRTQIRLSAVKAFNGTESVHVNAQQNSGGDLALTTSAGYARFSAELLDV